ncbi:hypothetical protein [Streptomyces shenzhenensis]|uniref:AraC-like ligand-binding domain-containing protein n=1 Tax=Streptomyces shenzhenensis TaxID=943815 RepID=UPI0033CA4667
MEAVPEAGERFVHTSTLEETGSAAVHLSSNQRYVALGDDRVTLGAYTFLSDSAIKSDDVGSHYYVHLPLRGAMYSSYSGAAVTLTPEIAGVYRPMSGAFLGHWKAGSRVLCVRLSADIVHEAAQEITGSHVPYEALRTELTLPMSHPRSRAWVGLISSIEKLKPAPEMLSNPLIYRPLAESIGCVQGNGVRVRPDPGVCPGIGMVPA